ncbi:MAG: hypothetical protein ACYC9Q_09830 [Bacillota bacterium]
MGINSGWGRRLLAYRILLASLTLSLLLGAPGSPHGLAAGTGTTVAVPEPVGSAPLAIPEPSSLPDWAAGPAEELVTAGITAPSGQSPAIFTRGSFMTLAVSCTGRSTTGWPGSLQQESIQVGRPDGSLGLDDAITRGEAVAFLVKLLRAEPESEALQQSAGGAPPGSGHPPDTAGHWSEPFFIDALRWGLVRGAPDGLVRPDAALSMAEGLTLADRFLHVGEGLLPLESGLQQNAAVLAAVERHVRGFVEVFAREPYDFAPLLSTCVGQARVLISQNQRYYLDRYALGSRFRFELLSFESRVGTKSFFLAGVTTREKMREYVNGKVEESEDEDRMALRRVGPTWLIYK